MNASRVLLARKNFVGVVVSTAMQKTVRVRVPKTKIHPKIGKEYVEHKNYMAHDENQVCKLGDVVRIEHCKKLSKKKSFAVAEMVREARVYIDPETGAIKR
ncbi:37S ribosomal protein S17, mitochondrial [Smittium culicis]|uniref:37S ribosomal protein S17, mitochondrial n=1 Tax=Smittium culicis TaxID=133412 RepID=A0A1R1YA43_9FUNG|nr:37S ribosomal protein S17, mitochondrial [Smittium culicis]